MSHPYMEKKVFVRTVTHYYTGMCVAVDEHEIVLRDAAWIASTKRFADTMKDGEFSEVEPYPDGLEVRVSRGALVDWCEWKHELPRKQQ